ncbi:DUF6485 family protein [Chloroflexota bacterium]
MECLIETNILRCNCTYPGCEHKGKCCDCIAHHKRFDELPACLFPDDVEKTFNRSVERFIDLHRPRV